GFRRDETDARFRWLKGAVSAAGAFGKERKQAVHFQSEQRVFHRFYVGGAVAIDGNGPDTIEPPAGNFVSPKRAPGEKGDAPAHEAADQRRIEMAGVVDGQDAGPVSRYIFQTCDVANDELLQNITGDAVADPVDALGKRAGRHDW